MGRVEGKGGRVWLEGMKYDNNYDSMQRCAKKICLDIVNHPLLEIYLPKSQYYCTRIRTVLCLSVVRLSPYFFPPTGYEQCFIHGC